MKNVDTVERARYSLKKKIIIVICIAIIILLIVIGIITRNKIQKNEEIKTAQETEAQTEILDYRILDNTTDIIKGVVKVQCEDGITEIEYPKANEKEKIIDLNCNGKKSVYIDYNVKYEEEYNFLIKTNTDTINKTLKVDTNFLDKFIKIEESSLSPYYNNAKIEYNNEEEITKYYKLKDIDSDWKIYNGEICLDESDSSLDNVTVMAKTVEQNGNTIQNEKTIKLKKNQLKTINVFNDYETYEVNGMSLAEYGFSYENFYRVENFRFGKRNFWISHSDYVRSYGGTFVLDYSRFQNITTKRIDAKFNWGYTGYYKGGPYFSVNIIYKDGTIKNKGAIWNGKCYLVKIGALNNEIDKIKFNLDLIDSDFGSSWGALQDIDIIAVDE